MGDSITYVGTQYSSAVGLVYVFNLIVGTGALAMPKAFASAGWLLSMVLIVLLAAMSYLTVTFVVEAMASANAVLKLKRIESRKIPNGSESITNTDLADTGEGPVPVWSDEDTPLLCSTSSGDSGSLTRANLFSISERIEMGQMASLFFNKVGVNLFYICIAVYLYGDLAIYAAAVPKSIRDVACTYKHLGINGTDCNTTELIGSDLCWPGVEAVNRDNAYRIFVAAFMVLVGPFVFFDVQKTLILQIFTTLMRWLSFSMMIVLTLIRLSKGQGQGHPVIANFDGIPSVFGVCVYAFMCHHSLPSLVTPIKKKSKLFILFSADYILILAFYMTLSLTGIFSFKTLLDVYTLNFQPNSCEPGSEPITKIVFIQYFLALFPAFTLSTNFPIIGVTLRNNLKTLFHRENKPYPWAVDKLVFPILALIPAMAIAFATDNVEFLVSITGSYAGAGIQYLIPAALVYFSRKKLLFTVGPGVENNHQSPFKSVFWVILVVTWAFVCITFVTVNHIITRK